MKLVNAEIISKSQLAQRLIDGEVFHFKEDQIFFQPSHANPFRYGGGNMNLIWEDYRRFWMEEEWIPESSVPVICYVGDTEHALSLKSAVSLINDYCVGALFPFIDTKGTAFAFAKPVTADDLIEEEI